jgi:membrane associated rhomboid family serine protease
MKNVDKIQNSAEEFLFPCPNATSTADFICTLSELCGFNGVPNPHPGGTLDDKPEPNQWFRFIIPMFLHTGIIHIGFNLLVQLTMAADMERTVGWWRFAFVYLASGIWGFVLGGNYASQGESSCGCSGSLFGILALYILDLFYTWGERSSPWAELVIMIFGIGISFVLGLLPGLDNFSHIGGFIMGLASGLCIMRSPNALRERIGLARNPYVAMSGAAGASTAPENKVTNPGSSIAEFFKAHKSPKSSKDSSALAFFKGRKPLWWAWWLVRLGALVAVLIGFILLIVDFYKYHSSNCSWCYRLSCLVSASILNLVQIRDMLTRYSRSTIGANGVKSKLSTQLQPETSFFCALKTWEGYRRRVKFRSAFSDILYKLGQAGCISIRSLVIFRHDFDVTIPRKRIFYGLESQSQSDNSWSDYYS